MSEHKLPASQTVTSDMQQAVFEIDGMTCEGCAPTVQTAIRQVSGVLAADIDYDKSIAIVGIEPGQPIPLKMTFKRCSIPGDTRVRYVNRQVDNFHVRIYN